MRLRTRNPDNNTRQLQRANSDLVVLWVEQRVERALVLAEVCVGEVEGHGAADERRVRQSATFDTEGQREVEN